MANPKNPSYRLTGINPLAYMGVEPLTPPGLIIQQRQPTINDSNFNIGQLWVIRDPNEIWMLVQLNDGEPATWVQLYPGGGGGTIVFETDLGQANPAGGILNVFGTSPITTTGSGNTVTVVLENGSNGQVIIGGGVGPAWANITAGAGITIVNGPNSITISSTDGEGIDSIDTNSGSVSPVAGTIEILGDNLINTSGAGNVLTVALDRSDDGQIPIGATGAPTVMANITAGTGITVTNAANSITINATGAGQGGEVIVTKFTSSDTWTKNANAQNITVILWAGGCGGGGGQSGTLGSGSTISGGGGGGCGGSVVINTIPALYFSATESVIVGAGGSGGASKTGGSGSGNIGSVGGYSSIGRLTSTAYDPLTNPGQGGNGIGVSIVNGGYGSLMCNGNMRVAASAGNTTFVGDISSSFGGRGASIQLTPGQQPGVFLSSGPFLCSGGGGGGGGSLLVTPVTGGNGGDIYSNDLLTPFVLGGIGGNPAGTIDGTNGNDFTMINGVVTGATGGGGGGGQFGVAPISHGGNGGNGGIPGGGGGGGGGSNNTVPSGAGGNGARGEVWVIEQLKA